MARLKAQPSGATHHAQAIPQKTFDILRDASRKKIEIDVPSVGDHLRVAATGFTGRNRMDLRLHVPRFAPENLLLLACDRRGRHNRDRRSVRFNAWQLAAGTLV